MAADLQTGLEIFLLRSYFKKTQLPGHPRSARIRFRPVATLDTSPASDGVLADVFRVVLSAPDSLDSRSPTRRTPAVLHWRRKNDDVHLPTDHRVHSLELSVSVDEPMAVHPDADVSDEFAPLVRPRLDLRVFATADHSADPLVHLTTDSVCVAVAFADDTRRVLKAVLGDQCAVAVQWTAGESRWRVGTGDWQTRQHSAEHAEHVLAIIGYWLLPNHYSSSQTYVLPETTALAEVLPIMFAKNLQRSTLLPTDFSQLISGFPDNSHQPATDPKIKSSFQAVLAHYHLQLNLESQFAKVFSSLKKPIKLKDQPDFQDYSTAVKELAKSIEASQITPNNTVFIGTTFKESAKRIRPVSATTICGLFKELLDNKDMLGQTAITRSSKLEYCLAYILKKIVTGSTSFVQTRVADSEPAAQPETIFSSLLQTRDLNRPHSNIFADSDLSVVVDANKLRVYKSAGPKQVEQTVYLRFTYALRR